MLLSVIQQTADFYRLYQKIGEVFDITTIKTIKGKNELIAVQNFLPSFVYFQDLMETVLSEIKNNPRSQDILRNAALSPEEKKTLLLEAFENIIYSNPFYLETNQKVRKLAKRMASTDTKLDAMRRFSKNTLPEEVSLFDTIPQKPTTINVLGQIFRRTDPVDEKNLLNTDFNKKAFLKEKIKKHLEFAIKYIVKKLNGDISDKALDDALNNKIFDFLKRKIVETDTINYYHIARYFEMFSDEPLDSTLLDILNTKVKNIPIRYHNLGEKISKKEFQAMLESNISSSNKMFDPEQYKNLFPLIQALAHNLRLVWHLVEEHWDEIIEKCRKNNTTTEEGVINFFLSPETIKIIDPFLIIDNTIKGKSKYCNFGNSKIGIHRLLWLLIHSKSYFGASKKRKQFLNDEGIVASKNSEEYAGELLNSCLEMFSGQNVKITTNNVSVLSRLFNMSYQDNHKTEYEAIKKLVTLIVHYAFTMPDVEKNPKSIPELTSKYWEFLTEIITINTSIQDPYTMPFYFAILAGIPYNQLDKVRTIISQYVRLGKNSISDNQSTIINYPDQSDDIDSDTTDEDTPIELNSRRQQYTDAYSDTSDEDTPITINRRRPQPQEMPDASHQKVLEIFQKIKKILGINIIKKGGKLPPLYNCTPFFVYLQSRMIDVLNMLKNDSGLQNIIEDTSINSNDKQDILIEKLVAMVPDLFGKDEVNLADRMFLANAKLRTIQTFANKKQTGDITLFDTISQDPANTSMLSQFFKRTDPVDEENLLYVNFDKNAFIKEKNKSTIRICIQYIFRELNNNVSIDNIEKALKGQIFDFLEYEIKYKDKINDYHIAPYLAMLSGKSLKNVKKNLNTANEPGINTSKKKRRVENFPYKNKRVKV